MQRVADVVIKIPPEAVPPLLAGTVALIVLLFFGAKLADWKRNSPINATRFGLVVAVLLTGVAVVFLARCLTNQSDPNNAGTGQLSFTDPPVAGFMAALATAFWRFANQRWIALAIGVAIGALMFAKPFVWPVMRIWEDGHRYARGMLDPEHAVFLGAGIVVLVTALISGLRKP